MVEGLIKVKNRIRGLKKMRDEPLTPKQEALLEWLELSIKERGLSPDLKSCNIIVCGWLIDDLYKLMDQTLGDSWRSKKCAR